MISGSSGFYQQTALAIPTVEQIRDVAASIPAAPYNQLGYSKGPRVYLTLSAGSVRIKVSDLARSEATRRRALDRRIREIDAVSKSERAWLNVPMALIETGEEAKARFDKIAAEAGLERLGKRGKITEWTKRSKARMEMRLRTLDYSPLFAAGDNPAMVTLTMPGNGWEELVPTPRSFKRKLDRFQLYYQRAWGSRLVGVWKMEFQRRGAPHLHILMTPPGGYSAGAVRAEFPAWLSLTWARVIGSTDPHERAKHVAAGTGIDYPEGARYRDPKRMAQYFSKHGAYASKDYQNQMPLLWSEAIERGAGGAAFWGYWGLLRAESTVELSTVPCAAENPSEAAYGALSAQSWEIEDTARWATDASVSRAFARDQAAGPASDAVRVERHLRKLSRSMAAIRRDGQIVQRKAKCRAKHKDGKHTGRCGQVVSSVRIRVVRGERPADPVTGEIRPYKDYRIGYYTAARESGFLSVNDGRISGDSIARVLGGSPWGSQSSWVLVG